MKTTLKFVGISFFILLIIGQSTAQTEFAKVYYKTYQEIQSRAVVKTVNDSYLIVGERDYQIFLMKINSAGDTLWEKSIGGQNYFDVFTNILSLNDSNFLLVSNYSNPDSSYLDLLCAKFDMEGEMLWARSVEFGSSVYPYSVQQTFDNGFIVTGRIRQHTAPYSKILLLKFDSTASLQWSKMLSGGNYYNQAFSVKQTADTGYIVSGYTGDRDPFLMFAFLMKLTPAGDIEWSNSYKLASSNYGEAFELIILEDGYLFAMQASDYLFIVKTDLSGNVLWAKKYNTYLEVYAEFHRLRFLKTDDGAFLISAPSWSTFDDLIKIDSTGEVLWAKRIEMYITDIAETKDDGFLIVGNGPVVGPKFFEKYDGHIGILKTDSFGQNSSECIHDIVINTEIDTIVNNPHAFTSETIDAFIFQPTLQFISEPLTVESGCVDYVGAVNENEFSNNIHVFPNPSNGIFTIQTTNGEQLSSLEVFNAFGRLVYQIDGIRRTEVVIDWSGNPAGIYIIELQMRDGSSMKKKMIKK